MNTRSLDYAKLATAIEVGDGEPYDEARLFECVRRSAANGDGCSYLAIARWKLNGINGEVDRVAAQAAYEKAEQCGCNCAIAEAMAHGLKEQRAGCFYAPIYDPGESCMDILLLVVRHALGIGPDTPQSIAKAKAVFELFSKKKLRNCIHQVIARDFLRFIRFKRLLGPKFKKFFMDRPIWPHDASDRDLDELCMELGSSTAAFLIVRAFQMIAWAEGWTNYPAWRRRAILSELKLRRVSLASLSASQASIGLRQNELSASGIIQPHVFTDPPADRPYFTSLRGLKYVSAGQRIKQIEPDGEIEEGAPALLTSDDFWIAMCIAF